MAENPDVEPEKYSLEEILERLKGKPDVGGEVVTRRDGTVAVRVRKRKRRSEQTTTKKKNRSRRAIIFQLGAALALIILALVGVVALTVYANSTKFHESFRDKLVVTTGADSSFTELSVTPLFTTASSATFLWPEGNFFHSLRLGQLKARVTPLTALGKVWAADSVTAASGDFVIGSLSKSGEQRKASKSSAQPLQVARLEVQNMKITAGEISQPGLQINNALAVLTTAKDTSQVKLSQGTVVFRGMPKLQLTNGLLDIHDKKVTLSLCRLADPENTNGVLAISGTLFPWNSSGMVELPICATDFPLEYFLGPHLKNIALGRIDTTGDNLDVVQMTKTFDMPMEAKIAFAPSSNGYVVLKNLPFLKTLAETLSDGWFKSPIFHDESSGLLIRKNGTVSLSNLKLLEKGKFAVQGDIFVDAEGKLGGSLRFGLTDAVIQTARSRAITKLVSPSVDGMRWVNVKLSGTAAAPQDDLVTKFLPPPKSAPSPDQQPPSFEDLTIPPK